VLANPSSPISVTDLLYPPLTMLRMSIATLGSMRLLTTRSISSVLYVATWGTILYCIRCLLATLFFTHSRIAGLSTALAAARTSVMDSRRIVSVTTYFTASGSLSSMEIGAYMGSSLITAISSAIFVPMLASSVSAISLA